jgi:hypothetical protein
MSETNHCLGCGEPYERFGAYSGPHYVSALGHDTWPEDAGMPYYTCRPGETTGEVYRTGPRPRGNAYIGGPDDGVKQYEPGTGGLASAHLSMPEGWKPTPLTGKQRRRLWRGRWRGRWYRTVGFRFGRYQDPYD